MIPLTTFPHLNATLNAASAFFLVTGYFFIRRKRIKPHKICMLAAVATSVLFLASYLYYHFHAGSTKFTGQGFLRAVYFTILLSHTILAVVNVPFVIITLTRALQEKFDHHARIARWTLPLWLYVSVTGVVVYVMLYHF